MKFLRIANGEQVHFAAETDDGMLHPLNLSPHDPGGYLALYERARAAGQTVTEFAAGLIGRAAPLGWTLAELDVAPAPNVPHLLMPYVPPEVWGAAFTYPVRPGVPDKYADARHAGRPVVFFKATSHRCVGPNDAVGSRTDSSAMIPEPELGLVLSESGETIGYTVVNDVSSRDLPQQHPLYVCYSKTFDRCVSLGPVVAPPEALPDPRNLDVTGRMSRGGQVMWDETGNTSRLTRTFEDLVRYTTSHNRVPTGTLLATGSAMSPPLDMHIVEGDHVEVIISGIGRLANAVVNV